MSGDEIDAAAEQAARRLAAPVLQKGYQIVGLHAYRDDLGALLFWRVRCKDPLTGKKWIRPMRLVGDNFELGEPPSPPEGKPLYNLHRIAAAKDDAIIFVVEGESCVDALESLGLVATTSGGADSCRSADWRALRNRTCIVWPDNDAAGAKYGSAVVSTLLGLKCSVTRIDVESLHLPAKGDCCDWISRNSKADASAVLSLPVIVATAPDTAPLVELRCAADITCLPIHWLWPGWLARGKLHILGGSPGTGKTTIAIAIAAAVSRGGAWPDNLHAPSGNVLIWSGEDDPADTLVPRLRAANADLTRVYFICDVNDGAGKRSFDPSTDMQLLEAEAQRIGDIALVVLDPVSSAVAGDSHKNSEVRRALQPLVDLASRQGAALVGITHFSKASSGRDPIERYIGSIAFGALPRLTMIAASGNTVHGPTRMLIRGKSNLGPEGDGFKFGLEQVQTDGIEASRVVWGVAVFGAARDLLDQLESASLEKLSARNEATEWLIEALSGGSRSTNGLKADAAEAGIAWRTLERVKSDLGVRPKKCGKSGTWYWELAGSVEGRQDRQETEPPNVGGLGGVGELSTTSPLDSTPEDDSAMHQQGPTTGTEADSQ